MCLGETARHHPALRLDMARGHVLAFAIDRGEGRLTVGAYAFFGIRRDEHQLITVRPLSISGPCASRAFSTAAHRARRFFICFFFVPSEFVDLYP